MIFTPDGIKKQEFNKSFRGFDKEEVHAFLEKLSFEFETLFNENETIKKELEEAKQQLEKLLQVENNIQKTLQETGEKSNKIIEEAQSKAGDILRLAEEKSTKLLQKSREEADKLKSAVSNLREEKEILITKLKTIINYQAHMLEMKLEGTDEKAKESKKPEKTSDVEIDINDIVKKLL
jgi:cell division initiation protein